MERARNLSGLIATVVLVLLSAGCQTWQEPVERRYPQLSLVLGNASFLLPDSISNSWAFQVVFFSGGTYSANYPHHNNDDTYSALARAVYRVGDSAGAYAYVAVNGVELPFQRLWPWNYLHDWGSGAGPQVGNPIVWSFQLTANSPMYQDTLMAPPGLGRLSISGDSVFYRNQPNVIRWENPEPGGEVGIEVSWAYASDTTDEMGGRAAFLGVVADNGSFTLTPQHLQEASVPPEAKALGITLYRVRWKNSLVYDGNKKAATIACVDKQIAAPLR